MGAGVLMGLGKASENIADDIGERLKQERLLEHRSTENTKDRDFQAGESKLSRDQNQDQFEAQSERADKQFESNEITAGMERERIGKLMSQIDIAIESDQIGLQAKKDLENVRTAIYSAETPEEGDALFTKLLNMQGEERDDKFEFKTVQSIDPDTLERVQSMLKLDPGTGDFEVIFDATGATNSGPMAPNQEDINELRANPNDQALIAEWDEAFPNNPASQYLSEAAPESAEPAVAQGSEVSPVTQSASLGATAAANDDLPPGGGVTLDNQSPVSLGAGAAAEVDISQYERPTTTGRPSGNREKGTAPPESVGRAAAISARGESRRQGTIQEAGTKVKALMDDMQFPAKDKKLITDAIESGLLSDDQEKALLAYLDE